MECSGNEILNVNFPVRLLSAFVFVSNGRGKGERLTHRHSETMIRIHYSPTFLNF